MEKDPVYWKTHKEVFYGELKKLDKDLAQYIYQETDSREALGFQKMVDSLVYDRRRQNQN